MRTELPNLPALLAFECAARHLSFVSAAAELNLAQSTVSHRVRLLESQLGCLLFERLPRNLKLTEAGKSYLPTVRKAFDELSTSTAGLFGIGTHNSISVRASISFGLLWLAPRLHLFKREYEHIGIRLLTSIWPDTLAKDEVDLEIRFGYGQWDGYHIELLNSDEAVMLCSPETFKRNGKITNIKQLTDKQLIHIISMEDLWIRLFTLNKLDFNTSNNSVFVDSSSAALELAATNNMYVLVPKILAAKHLTEKVLVRAHSVQLPINAAHYLLTPANAEPQKPEAALFRSWLVNMLEIS